MTSVYLVFEIQYESDDYESFEIPMLDSDHTKTFLTLKDAEDYLEEMKVKEMPRLLELAKKWEYKKTTYDELNDRFGVEHELEIKELVLTK
jgi:hypothetical protein